MACPDLFELKVDIMATVPAIIYFRLVDLPTKSNVPL